MNLLIGMDHEECQNTCASDGNGESNYVKLERQQLREPISEDKAIEGFRTYDEKVFVEVVVVEMAVDGFACQGDQGRSLL